MKDRVGELLTTLFIIAAGEYGAKSFYNKDKGCLSDTSHVTRKMVAQAKTELIAWLESHRCDHSEFCGIHPEWRDRVNNGDCDCEKPSQNALIDQLIAEIREGK